MDHDYDDVGDGDSSGVGDQTYWNDDVDPDDDDDDRID